MTIVCLAADFQDTPLAYLERLQAGAHAVHSLLENSSEHITGVAIVATCNRFEVYLDVLSPESTISDAISLIATAVRDDKAHVGRIFRVITGHNVARHLFSVAAGLESMVVGEDEISGQVTRALEEAQRRNTSTPRLYNLFRAAAMVSKKVSRLTGLGSSGRSMIASALEIALESGANLKNAHAAVIGTGAYARVVVAALKRHDVGQITVMSQSGRAAEFAARHDVTSSDYKDLVQVLTTADVVIGASGAHGAAVTAHHVTHSRTESSHVTPLTFIDVALPSDIDPAIGLLPHCTIISMESVRSRVAPAHSESVNQAERLVAESVKIFEADSRARSVDPVVIALRQHIGKSVDDEVEAIRRARGHEEAEFVRRSLLRVTNTLLHTPTVKAKEFARVGQASDYAQALAALFDLEVAFDD